MIVVTIDTHDPVPAERYETFGPFDNKKSAMEFIDQTKNDADDYFNDWDFFVCLLYETNQWGAPKAYPWPSDESGDD